MSAESRAHAQLRQGLATSRSMLQGIEQDHELQQRILAAATTIATALRGGGKLLLAGNGGSAADSQHIAAEFVCRFEQERPGLAAIALTTDSSILTAVSNDYGYEHVFARQLQALARPGDVLLAYSTSGRSANILAALAQARRLGLATIGMGGSRPSPLAEACDLLLAVPAERTATIQEGHLVIGHILCGLVEQALARP